MQDCTCAMKGPASCPRHREWGRLATVWDNGDLVPGYLASADGLADATDQRKADQS